MTIKIVQNDTRPALEFTITQNGSPVDLTGSTVKFNMKNQDTGAVKINGVSCTILDTENGTCKYSWVSGDTDTVGTYIGEVEITFPDSSKQTGYKQITVLIRDDI